jgi:hypothetical protein
MELHTAFVSRLTPRLRVRGFGFVLETSAQIKYADVWTFLLRQLGESAIEAIP